VIVFNPSGVGSGLDRVSAAGGVPLPLNLDVDGRWPWFLPDGQHFLYSANNSIRLGSLDSKQTKPLVESQSDAVYTQGHVLYLRDDTLMAQVFDLRRLTFGGEAVPIAENVKSIGAQRRGIFRRPKTAPCRTNRALRLPAINSPGWIAPANGWDPWTSQATSGRSISLPTADTRVHQEFRVLR
jgi:hypothetical protein